MTKIIIILVLAALQNPTPSSGEHAQPTKDQSTQKPAETNATNAVPKSSVPVANIDSPAGQERANDSSSQGESKSPKNEWGWTPDGVMAVTSVVMIVVGSAQFIMYWRQWCMMRLSLKQATTSSKSAIKHARESAEKGLRAYIAIVNSTYSNDNKDRTLFEPPNIYILHIENTGQTPAYNVKSNSTWDYVDGFDAKWPVEKTFKTAEEIDAETSGAGSRDTLGKGHEMRYRCVLSAKRNGLSITDAFQFAIDKKVTIFVYGTVTYTDAFKKDRYTNFCAATVCFKPNEIHLSSYDQHNEAT